MSGNTPSCLRPRAVERVFGYALAFCLGWPDPQALLRSRERTIARALDGSRYQTGADYGTLASFEPV
jgi:hypothetical protein